MSLLVWLAVATVGYFLVALPLAVAVGRMMRGPASEVPYPAEPAYAVLADAASR